MDPLPNLLGAISAQFQVNIILTVFVILLLLCSAFFSSAETAFSTVSNIRIKNYADEKRKGARKALYICENFDKALSTILVGNNLVNIACTTICAFIFSTVILNPTLANLLNTIIMTLIVLIFGEITPKAKAKQNPEKYALRYANTMFVVIKLFTPITYFFIRFQKALLKNANTDNPTVTEDELESIIDTMEEEGVIDSRDAELMQGVLDLGIKTAYDIMTPRVDVTAVDITDSVDKIKKLFIQTQYSRIPVFKEDIDHIVGILSQKDFFTSLLLNENKKIKDLIAEPLFLNENMKVDDIIRQMQKVKKHMAVVIDEHGGTSGIVTFEDAMEEMVGEIYDEHDDDEEAISTIKQMENGKYLVNAEMELEEMFKYLGIEHLPETQYNTLGGFLFELAKNLPKTGQELDFVTIDERIDKDANYIEKVVKMNFKLVKVSDNRIRQVLLTVADM